MEGWVDEADHHRQPGHGFEDAREVATLDRQQPREVFLALARRVREDHRLHDREAVLLHEHVLGSAKADPLCPVLTCLDGVSRIVRVGPHLQAAQLIGPTEDCLRARMLAQRPGFDGRHAAYVNVTRDAVDRDLLTLFDPGAVDREGARAFVHHDARRADDARPPHAACNQRGMAGGASGLGEDALRLDHAMHVVRVGLDADQDDGLALPAPPLSRVGVEDCGTGGRAR